MMAVRFGGCVYGPGLFLTDEEAYAVKQELLARGTKASLRLADEIGMPSGGTVYSGETVGAPTGREALA